MSRLREQQSRKDQERGQEIAYQISQFVNRLGNDEAEQAAVEQMVNREHPTLQQNTMRFVLRYLQAMAAKDYTDLRNEASVELARKMVEAAGEYPYLPHV